MTNPVQLRIVQGCAISSGQWTPVYKGSYQIIIRDLGNDKKVSIWKKTKFAWKDIHARFIEKVPGGFELWEAPAINLDEPFSAKYSVNGQTYWDNNENLNYKFPCAQGQELEAITGADFKIVLMQASLNDGLLSILAGVQNLAYTKIVGAEYSINENSEIQKSNGFYNRTMTSGLEEWKIEIPVNNANEIRFALFYEVLEMSFRDNNFQRKYIVSSDHPIFPECIKRQNDAMV